MSLFLRTERLKHYFPSGVKHCIRRPRAPDNDLVLDAKELAKRLRAAMDDAKPPVLSVDLAQACGVTPQAVSGWRKNGRLAKGHLPAISRMTGKPLEYFVSENVQGKNHQGIPTKPWLSEKVMDEERFLIVFRTWQDARDTDRENLVAIAQSTRKAHGTRRKRTG